MWLLMLLLTSTVINSSFSGVYYPNLNFSFEVYAGAWLSSRQKVVSSQDAFNKIDCLEGGSFSMVNERTLMTRDFFDFQVLHLSSTTNHMPERRSSKFLSTLKKKLAKTIEVLKLHPVDDDEVDWRLRNGTVALIPFSSRPASSDISPFLKLFMSYDPFQIQIRSLYFEATFWSVYRFVSHICVTVASKQDLDALRSMNLPVWKIIDLSHLFNPKAKQWSPGSHHFLPKESLLFLVNELQDFGHTTPWNAFEFVYFTEADQVLHLRSTSHIMDLLEADKAFLTIAPHRIQVPSMPQRASLPWLSH